MINLFLLYNFDSDLILIEDPVASHPDREQPGDSTDDFVQDDKEELKICTCNSCPELSAEEFSKCCQTDAKVRERSVVEEIPCICDSLNLRQLLDKVYSSKLASNYGRGYLPRHLKTTIAFTKKLGSH